MSCKKGDSCCNMEVVSNCVACDWTLQGDENSSVGSPTENTVLSQIIYTVNGLCPIVSGKIKYCTANWPGEDAAGRVAPLSVLVQFLRGQQVVETQQVYLGSCISFTAAKFDKIQVSRVSEDPGRFTLSGEFCITPNFTTH